MLSERYEISEDERSKIITGAFSSLKPLKLRAIPSKEKKKVVVLDEISHELERDRRYTEKELNELLRNIHEDFATLRRHLIDFGYMNRTGDCKEYWVR